MKLPFDDDSTGKRTSVENAIDAIPDANMTSFAPFRTLTEYFSNTTHLLCSTDEFRAYVQSKLGFRRCNPLKLTANYSRANASPRTRGEPRPDQLQRIARVLSDDMRLWERACGERHRVRVKWL